jgi:glutamine amidotransferase
MCRLAAYLVSAIPLQQFLIDPPHSLYRQSWEPGELKYTKLNADGYGFGWYNRERIASTYTCTAPIWGDNNLPDLAATLCEPLWIAEVRSATPGNPVHTFNTAPFSDDKYLFAHNGFIHDFHAQVLPEILQILSPGSIAKIRGNTDSEYLFIILRQLLLGDKTADLPGAIRKLFRLIANWIDDQSALLNIVISDGERLYAARHGLNHESPSLYYTTDDELFPGGQLVASERFSENGFWQPVPEHHILVLDPNNPPELQAL